MEPYLYKNFEVSLSRRFSHQISVGGTSPWNRKNCCRNLVLSSEVYTFRKDVELQDIFSRKLWKKSIFYRDLDQKISEFSWNFSEFSSLLVQTCNVLQAAQWKAFLNLDDLSTNSSRFSPKISRIFMPFAIVLLYLSYFWAFLINSSTR